MQGDTSLLEGHFPRFCFHRLHLPSPPAFSPPSTPSAFPSFPLPSHQLFIDSFIANSWLGKYERAQALYDK